MDLKAAEAAVISHLEEVIAASDVRLPVRAMPNLSRGQFPMLSAVAEFYVKYNGSAFSKPLFRDGSLSQQRTPRIVIITRTRNLSPRNGQASTYQYLQLLSDALVGWTLPGIPDAGVCWQTSEGYLDEIEGIWWYQSSFDFALPEVTAMQAAA